VQKHNEIGKDNMKWVGFFFNLLLF